jgi:hypothetical protein
MSVIWKDRDGDAFWQEDESLGITSLSLKPENVFQFSEKA